MEVRSELQSLVRAAFRSQAESPCSADLLKFAILAKFLEDPSNEFVQRSMRMYIDAELRDKRDQSKATRNAQKTETRSMRAASMSASGVSTQTTCSTTSSLTSSSSTTSCSTSSTPSTASTSSTSSTPSTASTTSTSSSSTSSPPSTASTASTSSSSTTTSTTLTTSTTTATRTKQAKSCQGHEEMKQKSFSQDQLDAILKQVGPEECNLLFSFMNVLQALHVATQQPVKQEQPKPKDDECVFDDLSCKELELVAEFAQNLKKQRVPSVPK